jgi:alcohol dehydrogenase class IV
MRFGFAAPGRILFGPGEAEKAGSIAAGLGNKWLVVFDGRRPGLDSLAGRFGSNAQQPVIFPVSGEPDIGSILSAVKEGRKAGCDAVAGIWTRPRQLPRFSPIPAIPWITSKS